MSGKTRKPLRILVLTLIIIIAAVFIAILGKTCLQNLPFGAKGLKQTALGGDILKDLRAVKKDVLPIPPVVHEGYGHIVEGYKAQGAAEKIIIHIQDIHTNYEAQKNMSKILESLIQEQGLKLIMVEGGWGDVNLSYLRDYADQERRLDVAEEYLEEGKISGEEYLNIISDYDMDIQGIEEEDLYRRNLDSFFKIESFRGKGTSVIAELTEITDILKKKIYPASLLALEEKQAEYDEEEISLAEFYQYLLQLAKGERVNTECFPNFNSFMNIVELEESTEFAKIEKQRAKLIERLSKILKKDALTPLVTKSLEFRLNKVGSVEYHTYLLDIAKKAGEKLDKYPELFAYLEYIKAHEQINTNTLFKEAGSLEEQLQQHLAESKDQKNLLTLSRVLEILDNFLNLKLIPDDFLYYKQQSQDFLISKWHPFIKEKIAEYNLKRPLPEQTTILDENLSTLVEFYDIANQRDTVFLKKSIELMNEKEQNLAVLITGGFHTPNLISMFKDQGISYIIVAPKTTEKTDPDQYRYILEYKSGRTE